MPILTLIRSAGRSRIDLATNESSIALPEKPRFTRSRFASEATNAGQVVLGVSALEPWLIELPWWIQMGRSVCAGVTGASVRKPTTSVRS